MMSSPSPRTSGSTNTALQGVWMLVLLGGLLMSLWASWQVQAGLNYQYSFWYDWYDIDQHIERFGPQNQYKFGFHKLPASEHYRLFDDIAIAVHQHGHGLGDIRYQYTDNTDAIRTETLLTADEVGHLQDVANLIDAINCLALWVAIVSLALLAGLWRNKVAIRWRPLLAWLLGSIAVIVAAVFIIGPREVFYQLHVLLFSGGHPWFFYYQESLMSTLMKAPYLFGGIGVFIFTGGLVVFALLLWLGRLAARKQGGAPH